MAIIDGFRLEMEHESGLTRKMFEVFPENAIDWAPHPKSMKAGALATHIADMHGWMGDILTKDELDMKMEDFKPWHFKTRAELLARFEEKLAVGLAALNGVDDAGMMKVWKLRIDGNVLFAMPRVAVMRGMVMNHIIHHRAQLGVYYRICGVALPAIYGPSADAEK